MDADPLGGLYKFLIFLGALGSGFFLFYGIWENLLKSLFHQAQEVEEKSVIKGLRKIIFSQDIYFLCGKFY